MTVNHGVLGSSPCSGAIARGLQKEIFQRQHNRVQRVNKVSVDSNFIEVERSAVPSLSEREFSSAGLEHLPYKQRVGGSNPSTPTKSRRQFLLSSFFVFVDESGQSVAFRVTSLRVAIVCCRKSLSLPNNCL